MLNKQDVIQKLYYHTAYEIIKHSLLGKTSWYTTQLLDNDIQDFILEFQPLMSQKNNLLYFKLLIQWFVEYVGDNKEKYKDFVEYKIDDIPRVIQQIISNEELKNKYNLFSMSFAKFTLIQNEILQKNIISQKTFLKNTQNKYELIAIQKYKDFYDLFGGYNTGYSTNAKVTGWCVANSKKIYNFWLQRYNKTNMYFVLAKNGWKDIKPIKTNNAYDDYGLSLIGLLVDIKHFELKAEVLRWNYIINPGLVNPGASIDHAFKDNWYELNSLANFNVKDKCIEIIQNLNKKLS